MKVTWRFLFILSAGLATMNMLRCMEEVRQEKKPGGVFRSARVVPINDDAELPPKEKERASSNDADESAGCSEELREHPRSRHEQHRSNVADRVGQGHILPLGVRRCRVRKAWKDPEEEEVDHIDSSIPRCIPKKFRGRVQMYKNGGAGSSSKCTIYTIPEHEHQVQDPLNFSIEDYQDFNSSQYASGETRLHDAILLDDKTRIDTILNDAELCQDLINRYDLWGRTPLHIAVLKKNLRIARKLLSAGARVDLCDQDGRTVLHSAAEGGDVAIVDFLLRIPHIPINQQDRFGLTALHLACMFNNSDVEIVRSLLTHPEIQVNIFDYQRSDSSESCTCKCTALDYACYPTLTFYGKRNNGAYRQIDDECFTNQYKVHDISDETSCFCCPCGGHSRQVFPMNSYADFCSASRQIRDLLEQHGARHGTVCDSCSSYDHRDVVRARAQKEAEQSVANDPEVRAMNDDARQATIDTIALDSAGSLRTRLKPGPRGSYLWLW